MKGKKIFPSTLLGSWAGLIIKLTYYTVAEEKDTNLISYVWGLPKNKRPTGSQAMGVYMPF